MDTQQLQTVGKPTLKAFCFVLQQNRVSMDSRGVCGQCAWTLARKSRYDRPDITSMQFLSIKQAARRVGKTEKTIRRLIEKIVAAETDAAGESTGKSHRDRNHLKPDPDTLRNLRQRNEPHKWRISTELIDRQWGSETSSSPLGPDTRREPAAPTDKDDVVIILKAQTDQLREQIRIKDRQLERKDNQIDGLNRSLHEATQSSNRYAGVIRDQLKRPTLPISVDFESGTVDQPTKKSTKQPETVSSVRNVAASTGPINAKPKPKVRVGDSDDTAATDDTSNDKIKKPWNRFFGRRR